MMRRLNDDLTISGSPSSQGAAAGADSVTTLGERRLLLAVLDDAIRIVGSAPLRSPAYLEARAWMFTDDWSHLFTFRNVCDALGIDAGHLRSAVKRHDPGRSFTKRPSLRRLFRSTDSEAA